jgi:hypothetical protein
MSIVQAVLIETDKGAKNRRAGTFVGINAVLPWHEMR